MKKLFFLAAMCCLVINSWATCVLIGDTISPGTAKIVNIRYNQDTHVLTFEDKYEPTFTAYKRSYEVYFYEYSEDYAFYINGSGGSYAPTFYGDGCNSNAFIPEPSSSAEEPSAHWWAKEYVSNCAGGTIEIDLSDVMPQITALGYNHVLVAINPAYYISYSAAPVEYSTYGDWHSWLKNVEHIRINTLVDRMPAGVIEVHTPTQVISNPGYNSPFEDYKHVYLCEGQDTAIMHVNIYPIEKVSSKVNYFWQTRKDNETTWTKKTTKSFTSKNWNDAATASTELSLDQNFTFESSDMDSVTYFRLCVYCGNDTVYSNEIQIDAKYRMQIYGPVHSKTKDTDWRGNKYLSQPLRFDTVTFEVNAQDTIFFKPYYDNRSECGVKIGGEIFSAPDGTACATNWTYSGLLEPQSNSFCFKFYVGDKLYTSFDKVLCGFTPEECDYTLENPSYPGVIFGNLWIDRATGNGYTKGDALTIYATHDKIFDALMDSIPEGALPLKFNIGGDKYVYFSKGNLQYQASTDTWRFAENQYDCIGDAPGNNTAIANRATQSDWIDLFGFGTSGYNGVMPYETNYSQFPTTSINGTEYDWGVHNAISNGGNQKGQWRLLTASEWIDLLDAAYKYIVNVDGIGYMGVMTPNDFVLPAGATALADGANLTMDDYNAYNAAGVPFFPMAGYGIKIYNELFFDEVGTWSYYMSGHYHEQNMIPMSFRKLEDSFYHNLITFSYQLLISVRLVQDYGTPTGIEDIIENDNHNARKVMHNGQLVIIRDGKTYNAQGGRMK